MVWLMMSRQLCLYFSFFFFFNDTATTEIYTLSLHDALPIYGERHPALQDRLLPRPDDRHRSEEHTSELQSRQYLVCRLLLEKKKQNTIKRYSKKKKTNPTTHTYLQTKR